MLLLNVIEMIVLHKTSLYYGRFDDFHRLLFSLLNKKKLKSTLIEKNTEVLNKNPLSRVVNSIG
jgi:hypothetical protein